MRCVSLLLLLLAVAGALDPGALPRPAATASFCDRLAFSNGFDYTSSEGAHAAMFEFVSRAYNGAEFNLTRQPPAVRFVQGLLRNPTTLKYFNGEINYRSNPQSPYYPTPTPVYTSNPSAAYALDLKLVSFFGAHWGCTGRDKPEDEPGSRSFPEVYPYAGSEDMEAVHAGMDVTQKVFAAFIGQFAESALSMGATQHDFDRNVLPFLQSFARRAPDQADSYSICRDPSCACAAGWAGDDCSEKIDDKVVVDPGQGPVAPNLGPGDGVGHAAEATVAIVVAMLATLMAVGGQ